MAKKTKTDEAMERVAAYDASPEGKAEYEARHAARIGLTERPELSNHDHLFAAYLRERKALDNVHVIGNANHWYGPDGRLVAMAFYDNEACTYRVFVPA